MAYASKSLERSGTPKQNAIWGKLGDRFQAFAALWIGYELTFETTILQVPAFPGSVQQLTHCLRKRWRKLPPEPSKTQPGGTQIAPKSTPEAPMRAQMRPRAPKRRPKRAQERPRDAQERPKAAQERPRRVQDRPWRAPNASKNESGEVQDAFWSRLSQTAWFERLPKLFFAISRVVRVACDMCSDPIKLWFCHIQSVRTVQAHTHAKASKNRRPEAPKPTRNPLKLSPEPLKSHRRTQESAFKSSKTQKSSLKARMCAQ